MKTLYFDCFSGAAGDMLVAALVDAGADFDRVRAGLESLGLPDVTFSVEKATKGGVTGTRFIVSQNADKQPHRHLRHIVEMIERGQLPDPVKQAAKTTFERIAECEAEVHGTTVEGVHFHEVGAVDSIADVVGAHLAFHLLDVDRAVSSPLPLGSGSFACEHGVLPVPAPATALLVKGAACYGSDVAGELVTPTGAALVTQFAESFGPMPAMNLDAVGVGCGTRDIPGRANVLRVFLGTARDVMPATESVTVIESNIDDMNPELLPPLVTKLLENGALDAFLTPVLGKKGRPAHQITVLCDEARRDGLAAVLFRESTTLGVRIRSEQRICLEREWRQAATPWGAVRVKVGRLHGAHVNVAPEFEDCRRVAEEAGVAALTVYEAALAAAVEGETEHA